MLVVVSYDVAQNDNGKKRLRDVAKICKNYGQRVQYSVFECLVDPHQWLELKSKLEGIIKKDYDNLRYYYLGANWEKRVEQVGKRELFNPEGPLII